LILILFKIGSRHGTMAHHHCLDIMAHPLTSWSLSIIVVRLLGWWGGSPSVVTVSVGLVRWLAGHHHCSSI